MNEQLKKLHYQCDFCVIGGGLSGSFAALAAARMGARVILRQCILRDPHVGAGRPGGA